MNGYEALHNGAAVVDYSTRGRIRATGEDRKRLLHALTTNQVQEMEAGDTRYAFFLNAQGRILSDVWIYCGADYLLLDLEPEAREKIYAHLDRYIIADDVTLEDVTATTSELEVAGPGAPEPAAAAAVFRGTLTGQPGYRIVVSAAEREARIAELLQQGCVAGTAEEANVVRVENGVARYGEDITEANLAQETRIAAALHFSKGCYLGQEIVERVRSRGHVNKTLWPLTIAATEPPPPGAKVLSGDKEAGEITSAVFSPAQGVVRALAYLRATENLSVAGSAAQTVQQG